MELDWNDFESSVARKSSPGRAKSCGVSDFYHKVGNDAAEKIQAAFDNPELPSAGIHRAMTDYGFELSYGTVNRHKSRKCACWTQETE